MADVSEVSLRHRLELAVYPWRRVDPVPWAPLHTPLHKSRLALLTSAGLYRPAIDDSFAKVRGGDTSFRIIPDDVDVQSLAIGQTSDAFDHEPLKRDRNAGFPLDRLHELARDHVIGSVAPRHISINGSITAPGRLVRETGPRVAEILRADNVEAVLLVPI